MTKVTDVKAIQTVRNSFVNFRIELRRIAIFVAVLWVVFVVTQFFPALTQWGLIPRHVRGMIGIVTMTFLHSNWAHIASNTIPLVVLLTLLAGINANSWRVVVLIVLMGGAALWLLGTNANHIGASLLIFGLITFLITIGFIERRLASLGVALLVGLLYGIPLLQGVRPDIFQPVSNISWDGHLCGAVAGVAVARVVERKDRRSVTSGNIMAKRMNP